MMTMTTGKTIRLQRGVDYKKQLLDALGDISSFDVLQHYILVMTFVEPNITKGGLHMPDNVIDEAQFQGKIGLIVKMGPTAFSDDESRNIRWNKDSVLKVGDFVMYKASSGMGMLVNFVHCRLFKQEDEMLARVRDPEAFW